jgi:kynurenine formamidase
VNTVKEPRVIDLSHSIEHGMTTYPGLPVPEICSYMSRAESRRKYAAGTEFDIGQMTLVANTGTYIDAPFHRYPDGADLAALDLARLVHLPGIRIDATQAGQGIGPGLFAGLNLAGRAVLIRTGWDQHWRTSRYGAPEHPFLTASAVARLVDAGPALIGIDSVNIDDMADMNRPAHTGLLGARIPIIEHMRGLAELPDDGFRFYAAPVGIVGMGSFPVRAYAIVA